MAGTIHALVMGTSGVMNDGITSWMRQTFAAMDKSDFDLVTVAFEGAPEDVVRGVEGIGFEVLRVPSRKANPRAYVSAFREFLDKRRFDIIHVSCNSALAAFELREARRHGIPMRIAHSHNTTCQHKRADRLLRPTFYRELTERYACGRDAGKWLFGNRPFTVVPNGKELGDWAFSPTARADARAELGLADGQVAIGHVGRFNKQKNHQKLLHTFAELRHRSNTYRLVLVGDGAFLEETRRLAVELNIAESVTFLGRRDDVPRLLNAMDCMVLPSLYEGFPNVVLEWQLSGLPVVMSDTITDDVAITSLVSEVSLDVSDAGWADMIESSLESRDREADSAAARVIAKEQGYDINDDAALLRGLYLEGVARCS
jgi:glycosyltransferase involved in cell wall biosynthesis